MATEKTKILVVDDQESVRDILSNMLTREGYEVITAPTGSEALEKIKEKNFSLVISDIKMPKMDGFGVLRGVKSTNPNIPVIFLTAVGEKEIVIQAMKEGVADYIEKPFQLNKVLKVVKEKLK